MIAFSPILSVDETPVAVTPPVPWPGLVVQYAVVHNPANATIFAHIGDATYPVLTGTVVVLPHGGPAPTVAASTSADGTGSPSANVNITLGWGVA